MPSNDHSTKKIIIKMITVDIMAIKKERSVFCV